MKAPKGATTQAMGGQGVEYGNEGADGGEQEISDQEPGSRGSGDPNLPEELILDTSGQLGSQ